MKQKRILALLLLPLIGIMLMNANDILNNTDPNEIRNILKRLKPGRSVVSNIIVNQAPNQYPPLPSDTDNGLGWINVKDYGALGDGVNNDTLAVTNAIAALTAAGGGVLYFPPGIYLTSGGFTISVNAMILGMGMGDFQSNNAISEIRCNSATVSCFTVTAGRAMFRDISLKNVAGSTPSAGAGITVAGSSVRQRVDYDGVSVYGFYIDIDVQVGQEWVMRNSSINAPVLYALKIRNTINSDAGDWSITDSHFDAELYNSDAAIRIESSGGGKIENIKINSADASNFFNHGIDVHPTGTTSVFILSNSSIENVRGNGVNIVTTSAGYDYIVIDGIQFALYQSATGNAIYISSSTLGLIDTVVIGDCVFAGGTSSPAISLTKIDAVAISGCVNKDFASFITTSGCTNVEIARPGSSVTTENSYGQSSAVGTSTYWAREDHTHGSPSLGTATPQDVGSAGAAGSGSTPSKNDHAHKGVHSLAKSGGTALYGDVTIAEGANITITPSGNDLQISSIATGSSSGAGQVQDVARWVSDGGTTFELPDVAEYLVDVFDNGSLVDPLTYSLSSDRTQVVFDSSVTAGHVVVADYIVVQV